MMGEQVNFDLISILDFFYTHKGIKKIEGTTELKGRVYSFKAYIVPHPSGGPIFRIDVKGVLSNDK